MLAVGDCCGHRSTRNGPRWKIANGHQSLPGSQDSPMFLVLNRRPRATHQPGIIHANAVCSDASLHFTSPNWTSSAAAAVNNYGVLNCQNDIRQWKQAKARSGSAPLWAEWCEKRRFVCRRVIIRMSIHEGHQAFSQKDDAFEGDSGHDPVRRRRRTRRDETSRQPVSSRRAF